MFGLRRDFDKQYPEPSSSAATAATAAAAAATAAVDVEREKTPKELEREKMKSAILSAELRLEATKIEAEKIAQQLEEGLRSPILGRRGEGEENQQLNKAHKANDASS